MQRPTAGDIADLLGADYEGDRNLRIEAVRPLGEAGESDLSFLSNPKYRSTLESTRAGVVLVSRKEQTVSRRWMRVDDPYFALATVLQKWFSEIPRPEGISPLASIASSASVAGSARIAPFVRIGERCTIGENVTIFEGTSIGAESEIGDDTTIYANVTVYHRTRIGRRCIIHGGATLGGDGYGFATVGGVHHKIPQIGIVRIEDDVEIGSGTTIDRAALGETVIGEGTKIDNLVQIGHNVRIGRHCLIVSQVGISGSTEIGDHCILAGQAGLYGHLKLANGVQVAARAEVSKSWDEAGVIAGSPARPLREHLRSVAMIRRIPELLERIARLERGERTGDRQPR